MPQDNERAFQSAIKETLSTTIPPKYTVHEGKSILYKIEVNALGKVTPNSIDVPVRGQYAFQTDILIEKKDPPIPLVVLELKWGGFTSHNVIVYSSNAIRHKGIYPYLRYGFIVGGVPALSRRFLTHKEGFDFAMAVPTMDGVRGKEFLSLVKRQLAAAEELTTLMQSDRINLTRYEESVSVARTSHVKLNTDETGS